MVSTLKFYIAYQAVGLISLASVGVVYWIKQQRVETPKRHIRSKNKILNSDSEVYKAARDAIGKSILDSLKHL